MATKKRKTAKRGNNEGSIFQRPDGKWVACVTVGYNDEGRQQRKYFYGQTKQEVTIKMTTRMSEIVVGGCTSIQNDNIEILLREWLNTFKQAEVSARTYEAEIMRAKNHIYPAIGHLRLQSITTATIQSLLNKMLIKGFSLATVRKVKFLLNQFFTYCEDCKFISQNPVEKCIVKATKEHKEQTKEVYKAIPIEARQRFLAAIGNDDFFEPLCLIQMFGGLRIGEALALKWKDIDFEKHSINIDNAITEIPVLDSKQVCLSRTTVISDTKTSASIREVPIPEFLEASLLKWKERRTERQVITGISFVGQEDIVFSNNDGKLRTYSGTRCMFDRLMKKNGLTQYGIHFHSLRHTYSSMLFESQENPKIIQLLLGHRDVTTTIRTYNSVDRSFFKQTVDKLSLKYNKTE